jgi:hypothetical protein
MSLDHPVSSWVVSWKCKPHQSLCHFSEVGENCFQYFLNTLTLDKTDLQPMTLVMILNNVNSLILDDWHSLFITREQFLKMCSICLLRLHTGRFNKPLIRSVQSIQGWIKCSDKLQWKSAIIRSSRLIYLTVFHKSHNIPAVNQFCNLLPNMLTKMTLISVLSKVHNSRETVHFFKPRQIQACSSMLPKPWATHSDSLQSCLHWCQ